MSSKAFEFNGNKFLLTSSHHGAFNAVTSGGTLASCCGSAVFFDGDEDKYKKLNMGIQILVSDKEVLFDNTEEAEYNSLQTEHGFINMKFNVGGKNKGDDSWIPRWGYPGDRDEKEIPYSERDYSADYVNSLYKMGAVSRYAEDFNRERFPRRIFAVYLHGMDGFMTKEQVRRHYGNHLTEDQCKWHMDAKEKTLALFETGDILLFLRSIDIGQLSRWNNLLKLGGMKQLFESATVWNSNYPKDLGYLPRLTLNIMEKQ